MALWTPQNLRAEVAKVVAGAKFQQKSKVIDDLISGAAMVFLTKGAGNPLSPASTMGLPNLPPVKNSVGRPDQEALRNVVISALFRAWMLGKQKYPTINNKNHNASEFVVFAEAVFMGLGIGKIENHLEEFRSYRKKVLEDSGFEVVRGKVN